MSSIQTVRTIETNLDLVKLIREVQCRPEVWGVTNKDRIKRKQCWSEIAAIFASGNQLSTKARSKLRDKLHKEWRKIKREYTRYILGRKSRDGARRKAPSYSQHLEFLRHAMLKRISAKSTSTDQEEHEDDDDDGDDDDDDGDDDEDDEEDEEDEESDEEEDEETASAASTSSTPNVSRRQVGKRILQKRLHECLGKSLRLLGVYEKNAKIDDNDNRKFLLSLVGNLESLPGNINTACKVEILNCIREHEAMTLEYEEILRYHNELTISSYLRQQPRPFLAPIHHTQIQLPNQVHALTNNSDQVHPSTSYVGLIHPPTSYVDSVHPPTSYYVDSLHPSTSH